MSTKFRRGGGLSAGTTKKRSRQERDAEESERVQNALQEAQQSRIEWEMLQQDENERKKQKAAADELNQNRTYEDYADGDDDANSEKADDDDFAKCKMTNMQADGAAEDAAAAGDDDAKGAAGDDAKDGKDDDRKKKRGTYGNKDNKREKRKKKKTLEQQLARDNTGDDPDRYKILQVSGEQKARKIDTKRLCTYRDFDRPQDLKSFGGRFREMDDYDDID